MIERPPLVWTRKPFVPLLVLLVLAGAGVSSGQSDEAAATVRSLALDATMPQDREVRKGTLANGLTYYLRRNRLPERRAELRLVVKVGSVVEDDDQRGLAHVLEHMAFNGTAHFAKQELVDYLESIGMRFGADVNAYTSFDETVYMLQVPTDDAAILDRALLVLRDWAGDITLDPVEIDKERGVVIEEWRLGLGAGARVRDAQFPVLYWGSRYAERLPIGEPEVLRGFDPAVLKRFYRDWYRPDLMAVVVVGDFDPVALEAKIAERFSTLVAPPDPRPRPSHPVPEHDKTLVSVVTDPELASSSVGVVVKYPLPPENRLLDYRRSLVEGLWNGLLSARLDEVRQRSAAPFLGASSGQGTLAPGTGSYQLSAAVEEGGTLRGLSALLTEAERVRRFGFEPAELARGKSEFARFYERAFAERDKTESEVYAAEYTRNFLEDEPFPGIAFERAMVERFLPEIGLEEVNAVGKRWLDEKNRVVLVSGPQKEAAPPPAESALLAEFERAAEATLERWVDRTSDRPLLDPLPAGTPVVSRRAIPELGVTLWRLQNGVAVVLKPTDFKNDEVLFAGWSPGGHSLVGDEQFTSAQSAAEIVGTSGLGELDLIALEKRLAGKAVSIAPYIGELGEGVGGSASPQDLELLLQLAHLAFTRPRCDPQAFEAYLGRLRASVRNRRQRPEVVFGDEVSRVLTQSHPRRQPLDEARLEQIRLEDACRIYRDRFEDASDFTFALVGSFDPEAVEPLVVRYLSSLPARQRSETWRDVGVTYPRGAVRHTVNSGLEAKASVQMVWRGEMESTVQNRYELQSMASVLETRLREQLREERGGTYGVGVAASSARRPRPEYGLSLRFGCQPEAVDGLVAATMAELERLRREPISPTELSTLREQQRREREVAERTNNFWLGALRYYFEEGEDPLEIVRFRARIEGLSAEAIQRMAQRVIDLENHALFVLRPAASPAAAPALTPP